MPPSPPRGATSDGAPSPTVSVVIPALNEEHNLPLVLEGLPPVDEVIVVDGGSEDDTIAVAREVRPDAVIVRQTRHGKGNALACGFAASRGDIVVTVNADGSTDPGELPRFVDALLSGAEVAHGSRFREGGGQLDGRALDRLGNRLFSQFVNVFFGTRFTDLSYGYNAYWRSLLPALELPDPDQPLRRGQRLWGDGPEIEPLINIRMAAQGLRVVEVASVGYPPIHGGQDRDSLGRAQRALRTALAEYTRRWRTGGEPAAPGGPKQLGGPPRTAVARSSGGRSGGARPTGVPSAQARSAQVWQTDPRLETSSASRRRRQADEAAGIDAAPGIWVEDEEAMGRHSAGGNDGADGEDGREDFGRRDVTGRPWAEPEDRHEPGLWTDRRRGYPDRGVIGRPEPVTRHGYDEAAGAAPTRHGYPGPPSDRSTRHGYPESSWDRAASDAYPLTGRRSARDLPAAPTSAGWGPAPEQPPAGRRAARDLPPAPTSPSWGPASDQLPTRRRANRDLPPAQTSPSWSAPAQPPAPTSPGWGAVPSQPPAGRRAARDLPAAPTSASWGPTPDQLPTRRRAAPDLPPAPTSSGRGPGPDQLPTRRRAAPDLPAAPTSGRGAAPDQLPTRRRAAPDLPAAQTSSGRGPASDHLPTRRGAARELPAAPTSSSWGSADQPPTGRRAARDLPAAPTSSGWDTTGGERPAGRRAARDLPAAPTSSSWDTTGGERPAGRRAARDLPAAPTSSGWDTTGGERPAGRRAARELPAAPTSSSWGPAPEQPPAGRRAAREVAVPVEPPVPPRRSARDMTASIDQLRQGRRAAAESAPPAVADDFPQPSRRARRRAAEEAEAARQRAETGPGETGGRRALPEPERPRRAEERRRTYRDPGSESRGWTIPDEPWRGTEVPWRGPDGEYHTGSIPVVTDDGEPGGARRPDLTVLPGGADVREYESNYEGRDVAPLPPEPPYADDRPPPQPRSRHLKAVPGEPYRR